MRQDFSGVTEADRKALFPIMLRPHDPKWQDWYAEEAACLKRLLPLNAVRRISHIGSTAVPGLIAKPTVDILLEVGVAADVQAWTDTLLDHDYVVNRPPDDLIMFIKGYTPRGFADRVFHVHVRTLGDWDEPYFRDYLRETPEAAQAYARLKLRLARSHRNDRDGYTESKGAFVREATAKGAVSPDFQKRASLFYYNKGTNEAQQEKKPQPNVKQTNPET